MTSYEEKLALLDSLHKEVAGQLEALRSWDCAAVPFRDRSGKVRAAVRVLEIPKFSRLGRNGLPADFVNALYRAYRRGLSLKKIGSRFGGRSNNAIRDIFRRRGFKLRPGRGAKKKVEAVYKGLEYSEAERGYLRATSKPRKYLHQVIWEEQHGPMPKGARIFFRDGNKRNFAIENLACENRSEFWERVRPWDKRWPNPRLPGEGSPIPNPESK